MAINDNQIFEFRQNLFHDLRNELGHLKTCQTTLFLIGITGSGIFLALIGNGNFGISSAYLALLPLILLLPLWIIFYDKSRTIARIVGFIRVQEKFSLLGRTEGFIGWEIAMKRYWIWRDRLDNFDYDKYFDQVDDSIIDSIKEILQTLVNIILFRQPKTNSRQSIFNSTYWTSVYFLFFLFNCLCMFMSFYLFFNNSHYFIVIWFVVILCIAGLNSRFRFINKIRNSHYKDNSSKKHSKFLSIFKDNVIIVIISEIFILAIAFYYDGIEHIFPIIVFTLFSCMFIVASSIAYWMLINLVKKGGRYTYDSFETRWEFILTYKDFIHDKGEQKLRFL